MNIKILSNDYEPFGIMKDKIYRVISEDEHYFIVRKDGGNAACGIHKEDGEVITNYGMQEQLNKIFGNNIAEIVIKFK